MNPRISIVSPTVRPGLIGIVKKCLARQTFRDFEWLVCTPKPDEMAKEIGDAVIDVTILEDPPKKEGDYYTLNAGWNNGIKHARGELFVTIQDGLWFDPNLLQNLWDHYHDKPKSCVTAIGNQYDQMKNGKPENCVWHDPRVTMKPETYYQVAPNEMEFCLASVPMIGLYEVGGFDETFDKYAALGEKELCYRLLRRNYSFWIDKSIEYRAIHHPRLNDEWDERYNKGCEYFATCLQEISAEKRVKLNYL